MNDDYEDVRMAAIKLVWVFSQADPERFVFFRYNLHPSKLFAECFTYCRRKFCIALSM